MEVKIAFFRADVFYVYVDGVRIGSFIFDFNEKAFGFKLADSIWCINAAQLKAVLDALLTFNPKEYEPEEETIKLYDHGSTKGQ